MPIKWALNSLDLKHICLECEIKVLNCSYEVIFILFYETLHYMSGWCWSGCIPVVSLNYSATFWTGFRTTSLFLFLLPASSLPSCFSPPVRCFGWPDWHCCWLDEWSEGGRVSERHVVQPRAVLLDVQRDHLRWEGQVSSVEELGWANTWAGWGRLTLKGEISQSCCFIVLFKSKSQAQFPTNL